MSIKSISVLALIFSIQLLVSCIYPPCDCDPGIVQSVSYTNGHLVGLDTSGFSDEIVQDSVNRNSFGLRYESSFEYTSTATIQSPTFFGSFGFSAAMACSCVGETFKYTDPVVEVSILMVDAETMEEKNGDSAFSLYGYSDLQSLDEVDWNYYFNQEWYPDAYLNFELVDEDAVASSSMFKVVLMLQSGATLSTQTEVVNFFD